MADILSRLGLLPGRTSKRSILKGSAGTPGFSGGPRHELADLGATHRPQPRRRPNVTRWNQYTPDLGGVKCRDDINSKAESFVPHPSRPPRRICGLGVRFRTLPSFALLRLSVAPERAKQGR